MPTRVLAARLCCASLLIDDAQSVVDQNRPSGRARVALAALKKAASPAPPNVPIQDAPIQDARDPRRGKTSFASNPPFAGLVAFARRSDPIPSRTRPSNASAPMVLCLKTRESRSSPGLQSADYRKTWGRTTTDRSVARPGPPAGPSSSSLLKSPPLAAARISLRGAERPESLRSRRPSSRSPLPTSKPPPSRGGAAR